MQVSIAECWSHGVGLEVCYFTAAGEALSKVQRMEVNRQLQR